MAGLTIGQVAREAGLRASAIRYYESIDLLPAPVRIGGQRRYDAAILERLAFIGAARNLGFSLDEIRALLGGGETDTPLAARWQGLARRKLGEIDRVLAEATLIQQALRNGLDCGCVDLASCLGCIVEHAPALPEPR